MATQKERNWSSGDIVTAANLSSVERGVSAVAEEYTPTTWANGDTVTAAGLNNIEQGIVNAGGGGDSDFSTATLTVINNGYGGTNNFFAPNYYVEDGDSYITYMANLPDMELRRWEYNIILYKDGYTNIALDRQYLEGATFLISGDISDDDEGYFIVTGDCTITIGSGLPGGGSLPIT